MNPSFFVLDPFSSIHSFVRLSHLLAGWLAGSMLFVLAACMSRRCCCRRAAIELALIWAPHCVCASWRLARSFGRLVEPFAPACLRRRARIHFILSSARAEVAPRRRSTPRDNYNCNHNYVCERQQQQLAARQRAFWLLLGGVFGAWLKVTAAQQVVERARAAAQHAFGARSQRRPNANVGAQKSTKNQNLT